MLRMIAAVLLLVVFAAGCASLKGASRTDVEGSNKPMVSSSFEPEASEGCSQVATAVCPYVTNPFKTVQQACVEHVLPQANEVEADYIQVKEPKVSVGGFKTGSPKVSMYQCTNLKR